MKFKKEQMIQDREEWVLEIAGRTIPLQAIKSFLQAIFIVILVYFTYNIGHADAIAYINFLQTPRSSCTNEGVCTVCSPYAQDTKIEWDCSTIRIGSNHTELVLPG